MHHPNSQGASLPGRRDPAEHPVYPNLSCVRPHHAVRHMHQGGFSGAVFTEKGMNFAPGEREIGSVQGHDGAEALLHPSQLENRGHESVRVR